MPETLRFQVDRPTQLSAVNIISGGREALLAHLGSVPNIRTPRDYGSYPYAEVFEYGLGPQDQPRYLQSLRRDGLEEILLVGLSGGLDLAEVFLIGTGVDPNGLGLDQSSRAVLEEPNARGYRSILLSPLIRQLEAPLLKEIGDEVTYIGRLTQAEVVANYLRFNPQPDVSWDRIVGSRYGTDFQRTNLGNLVFEFPNQELTLALRVRRANDNPYGYDLGAFIG